MTIGASSVAGYAKADKGIDYGTGSESIPDRGNEFERSGAPGCLSRDPFWIESTLKGVLTAFEDFSLSPIVPRLPTALIHAAL